MNRRGQSALGSSIQHFCGVGQAWDRRGTGFVAQFRCYLRSGFVFGEEKVVHGGWD